MVTRLCSSPKSLYHVTSISKHVCFVCYIVPPTPVHIQLPIHHNHIPPPSKGVQQRALKMPKYPKNSKPEANPSTTPNDSPKRSSSGSSPGNNLVSSPICTSSDQSVHAALGSLDPYGLMYGDPFPGLVPQPQSQSQERKLELSKDNTPRDQRG